MQRERPLDSDAERLLADGERLAGPGALSLEDDPLENLGAAAAALDDLEVDAHAIARREGRKSLPLLATLNAVDYGAHVNCSLTLVITGDLVRSLGEKKPPDPGAGAARPRNRTYSGSFSSCSARALLCSARHARTRS